MRRQASRSRRSCSSRFRPAWRPSRRPRAGAACRNRATGWPWCRSRTSAGRRRTTGSAPGSRRRWPSTWSGSPGSQRSTAASRTVCPPARPGGGSARNGWSRAPTSGSASACESPRVWCTWRRARCRGRRTSPARSASCSRSRTGLPRRSPRIARPRRPSGESRRRGPPPRPGSSCPRAPGPRRPPPPHRGRPASRRALLPA